MRPRLYVGIIIFCGIILNSFAQVPDVWNTTGIGGGGSMFSPSINPIDPNEYYVACDMSELFHTTDFGLSYDIVDFRQLVSFTNSSVRFTNTSTLYCISYNADPSQPVKSTDNGITWNKLTGNPDDSEETYSIWANYENPNQVIISYWDYLFFSADGGSSFDIIHTGDPSSGMIVGGVLFDGNNIYIGTNDGVIYSTDGGTSFVTLPATGIPANERIFSFAAAKEGSTTRFVCLTGDENDTWLGIRGTDYWGFIRGVYSMDNLSGTWTSRISGIDINNDFLMFVAMAENDISTVFLGGGSSDSEPNIMKTSTAGLSWTWDHVFNTSSNQNIITGWCGTGGDRGWGYPECIFGITVCPTNKDVIIFSDMAFVTKSDDGGALWTQAYLDPSTQNPAGSNTPTKQYYKSVGFENTSTWFLHWCDNNNAIAAYTDIFALRSQDGGESWSFDYTVPSVANTMYHIVKNVSDNTLYAATSSVHDLYKSYRLEDDLIDDGTGAVIFSNNNGADWQTLHDFGKPVYWLATDPNNSERMYAAVVNHSDGLGGIYVTNNLSSGASSTWTQLSAPPRTEGHPATMTVLNNGDLLCSYSGRLNTNGDFTESSGIFVYSPSTSSWADKSDPNQHYWCHDIVVDPNDISQNTWYSCVYNGWGGIGNDMGGLYKTSNGGTNWTKILDNVDVSSCTFNPNNSDELFVSSHGYGLWHSSNINNATPNFTQVDNYKFGVPERIFFNPFDQNQIWITSFGHGLQWGYLLSPGVTEKNILKKVITVFPNPFSNKTTITFANNDNKNFTLDVYDAFGYLVIRKNDIASNPFVFDGSNLPRGLYFLQFSSKEGKNIIKKIIKE
ncbi:T9SS type A sorting domain-containing protein [Bacteroidota bacterium]